MNDFEHSNFDEGDPYEDFNVMASYKDNEGAIQEEQIGEVTLKKDIARGDMPYELEINSIIYKRED